MRKNCRVLSLLLICKHQICSDVAVCVHAWLLRANTSLKYAFNVRPERPGSSDWSSTPCSKLKLGVGFIYSLTLSFGLYDQMFLSLCRKWWGQRCHYSGCVHACTWSCFLLILCVQKVPSTISWLCNQNHIEGNLQFWLFHSYIWDNWRKSTSADTIDLPFLLPLQDWGPFKGSETYCLFFLHG